MDDYISLIKDVLKNGTREKNRTGVDSYSVFGNMSTYHVFKNFPIVTCKKVNFDLVLSELLWFISGNKDIKDLHFKNNHIWDEWAGPDGSIGPLYGSQWRSWQGPGTKDSYDQLAYCIDTLKKDPYSRRVVCSAWNPLFTPDTTVSPSDNVQIGNGSLSPCHMIFQFKGTPIIDTDFDQDGFSEAFYASGQPKTKLSLLLFQRSGDVGLGVPFNISSYSLLLKMVASLTGLLPYSFIHVIGDAHIYENHMGAMEEVLGLPLLENTAIVDINSSVSDIDSFTMEDFELKDYEHHPYIRLPIAV